MKVNGFLIKLTAKEIITILLEEIIQENGKMINKMAMEKKTGLMGLNTLEIIKMAKKMVKELLHGLMALNILGNLLKIIFMGLEFINGLMEGNMMGIGIMEKWKERGNLLGEMAKNMLDNISYKSNRCFLFFFLINIIF